MLKSVCVRETEREAGRRREMGGDGSSVFGGFFFTCLQLTSVSLYL